MNELVVADRASEWRRLKALVLDSVSSPITRRVYNLGLDEFIAWYTAEPRPAGFTKASASGIGCRVGNWLSLREPAIRGLNPAISPGSDAWTEFAGWVRELVSDVLDAAPQRKAQTSRNDGGSLRSFFTNGYRRTIQITL